MDVAALSGGRPWRAPVSFATAVVAAACVVVPWMSQSAGPSTAFLPAVLALVACFDLLSVYLLVQHFRGEGEPRTLAMAAAYTWSLVVMLGYAGAFPGVAGESPPFASAPSVAPWLYVCWHTGFPLLLGLAWAPWPRSWTRRVEDAARRRLLLTSQVAAMAAAAAWWPSSCPAAPVCPS